MIRTVDPIRPPRCLGRAILPTLLALALALPTSARAAPGAEEAASSPDDRLRYGFGLRVGGRYDDVRMCIASGAGVKGGPAAELSVFVDWRLWTAGRLQIDLPLLRPLLFGAAFSMLQLEPQATLKLYRGWLVFGPSLGLSLHYGPDYRSESDGPGRGPSFFAIGPTLGAYVGVQWTRPDGWFDLQLGLHPYVTPLFPTGDTAEGGVVAGGMLEIDFRVR